MFAAQQRLNVRRPGATACFRPIRPITEVSDNPDMHAATEYHADRFVRFRRIPFNQISFESLSDVPALEQCGDRCHALGMDALIQQASQSGDHSFASGEIELDLTKTFANRFSLATDIEFVRRLRRAHTREF